MRDRPNLSACGCKRDFNSNWSKSVKAIALCISWMHAASSYAQTSPLSETASRTTQAAAVQPVVEDTAEGSPDSDQPEALDSTEQGQTQLPESFEHRPIKALLAQSRLIGLRDTTFSVQLRSFYLDRDNFDASQSTAWTLGGSAGFKTGYFADFVALGATGYTSQRLYGPDDKDGTRLLQPGQQPYTVAGELYGQFRLTDTLSLTAGRRGFDTPFINTRDSLMTPNTFTVYAVQGETASADDSRSVSYGAGFVDKIKPRNAQDFESMATAAGAPAGIERGVYLAGANFKAGDFSIGAVEYSSPDIINIIYTETRYTVPVTGSVSLRFALQYTTQHSTGDDLLTGRAFSTDQYGRKADIVLGPTLLTAARTLTAVGTLYHDSGTNVRSPWGGYPGYTAVQLENFNRAGENATLLRAGSNVPTVAGLSMYALVVSGSTPNVVNQYAQREWDLNVQWKKAEKLTLLARYGHVSRGGPIDRREHEVRLVLYYQLR
jgi:outer membrane porin, OprD family